MNEKKSMREVFIESIWEHMHKDGKIFFLSADFGSIALDNIRKDFCDRFINVGIAEQNLVNLSVGLALEGYKVYAYAIAPFLSMRCYEQLRNLSMLAQLRELDVNLIGVGAGLSYDLSGPSHHSYEDITLMRLLPHVEVFSPSDWVVTKEIAKVSLIQKTPKYIRLDGKPLNRIYSGNVSLQRGFSILKEGRKVCLLSTGYMTHVSLRVVKELESAGIDSGLIDVFTLKGFNPKALYSSLSGYNRIITLEEGFINRGGFDSLIANLLIDNESEIKLKKIGFKGKYIFENGNRDALHKINSMDCGSIKKEVVKSWGKAGY